MSRSRVTVDGSVAVEQMSRDMDRLATIPARLGAADKRKIADRVRLGFHHNFQEESPGDFGYWDDLAARTVEERRELGYPGEHPILVRSGQYKLSWTDRSHHFHSEEWGSFGGVTVLTVGSEDPRVEPLSGGRFLQHLPPRPVHLLSDEDVRGIEDTCRHVIEEASRRGP